MDQLPNQPVSQTPPTTPAPTEARSNMPTSPTSGSGGSWGMLVGALIALLLIAGGVYYFLTQGAYPPVLEQQQAQQTPANDQTSDINAIESELNASGSADTSSDLSNLEQSL